MVQTGRPRTHDARASRPCKRPWAHNTDHSIICASTLAPTTANLFGPHSELSAHEMLSLLTCLTYLLWLSKRTFHFLWPFFWWINRYCNLLCPLLLWHLLPSGKTAYLSSWNLFPSPKMFTLEERTLFPLEWFLQCEAYILKHSGRNSPSQLYCTSCFSNSKSSQLRTKTVERILRAKFGRRGPRILVILSDVI